MRFTCVCVMVLAFVAVSSVAQGAAGDLDTTFSGDGIVITPIPPGALGDEAWGIAVDGSGRIVLAGSTGTSTAGDFAVVRYNSDGTLDTTFDGDGVVTTNFPANRGDNAFAVAIDSLGRILVAGRVNLAMSAGDFGVVRYNSNGSLDTTFGTSGYVVTDFGAVEQAFAMAIDSLDRIVVAGVSGSSFAVARYDATGALDTTFSGDGMAIGPAGFGRAVAIGAGDSIVVAGYTNTSNTADMVVARFDSSGALDAGFGSGGSLVLDLGTKDQAYAVVIDGSGRIVVGGCSGITAASNYAIARLNSNGTLDATFDGDGWLTTDVSGLDIVYGLAIDSFGSIVAAGISGSDSSLARYLPTGALDTSFSTDGMVVTDMAGGGMQDHVFAVTLDGTGAIVVAGRAFNGANYDFAAARYEAALPIPGEIQFNLVGYSIAENAGSAIITMTRTVGADGAVCVDYATSDGTATAGVDYTTATGTVCWGDADGVDKTFNVPILDDGLYEPDETVILTLSNPTGGAALGTPVTAVLTIINDDALQTTAVPTLSRTILTLLAGMLALAAALILIRRVA